MLPAAADVALISQLVSAALTVMGPGAPGADDVGAVLAQPASATAATAATPAMRGVRDMRVSPRTWWSRERAPWRVADGGRASARCRRRAPTRRLGATWSGGRS